MATTRILVVDDEEDLCEILKFNLEIEGYEVDTAYSAEEALKKDLTVYNLLLLDVIDMRPEVVNLVNDHGDVTIIDAEEAEIGDILLVRPGDRIPLDGIITDGETMIDTSPVTGEPIPVSASVGTDVTSGCLNTSLILSTS